MMLYLIRKLSEAHDPTGPVFTSTHTSARAGRTPFRGHRHLLIWMPSSWLISAKTIAAVIARLAMSHTGAVAQWPPRAAKHAA